MSTDTRLRSLRLLAPVLLLCTGALAQQPASAPSSTNRRINLDVVVTAKSGPPVAGLEERQFTVLDNKTPRALTSFRAVSGKSEPVEMVLVVDAVNTGYQNVAYARDQIDHFLRANGGKLPEPTALAVVTDTGVRIQDGFSTDGNALSAALENYVVGLRTIRRSSGYFGAEDRLQISLNALTQISEREAKRPGRKMIVWVSPGWPLLSGPGTMLSSKQQKNIFADVVRLSEQLRQSRITMYSVDPLGTADAGGFQTFYYQEFLKGVSKASDVALGDLSLQVLAAQSGGLVLNSSNDVTSLLERCMVDAQAFYEISFDAPPAERRDEYHHLEVQVAEPNLTARTRQGYYAQP